MVNLGFMLVKHKQVEGSDAWQGELHHFPGHDRRPLHGMQNWQ